MSGLIEGRNQAVLSNASHVAWRPEIEKHIVDAGIIVIKIWLEVGMEEQERRFKVRLEDPLRQWKLSDMDLKSYSRWYDYSRARDAMLKQTDSKHGPLDYCALG